MIDKESITKDELILLEFWRRTTKEDWLLIPNKTKGKIKSKRIKKITNSI